MSRTWQNGFWDCFSNGGDCFLSCCCPCFTYGEVDYRLKNEGDTNAQNYSMVNGACLAYYFVGYITCGIYSCIVTSTQRTEVRSRLGIEGSSGKDILAGTCCHCCTLIQNKHEFVDMQERKGIYSQGAATQPAAQAGMAYTKPE